jgi:hypothetical protein
VPFGEFRLVVEGVHLAGAAVHEELDDAAGLGGVVEAAVEFGPRIGGVGQQLMHAEQVGERDAAQTAAAAPKEIAAGRNGRWLTPEWHC